MSYITLKCKNCGANMSLSTESHTATCIHCSSTFLISELLDEKDMAFMSKFSKSELEDKMLASDAIKQGETLLFRGEYEKAEFSFKKAIELDENNYKSYFGVVKAKTQNFNKLPENDDYLQYAHYAESLATGDDLVLVKSELSKLDLLVREKRRQKKIHSSILKQEEVNKIRRRENRNIFTVIGIFILLMTVAFVFTCSMFTGIVFDDPTKKQSISVDSYEKLERVLSHEKFASYDINITADIDCDGNSIVPLGSPTKAYTGTFNGNNHTISNLVIDPDNKSYVGLFGYTVLASIKNLVLDNVSLTVAGDPDVVSTSYYGLVAGKAEATTFSNIEIKNTCKINIERNTYYPTSIGGVVGSAINASFISGISAHTKLNTSLTHITCPTYSSIGGVVGTTQNSVIQKTCSNSSIIALVSSSSFKTSNLYIGGIIGSLLSPTLKDTLNITYNNFSGTISASYPDTVTKFISAIAYSGITPTKKLNNSCLYTLTNFYANSERVSFSKLKDYLYNEYIVEFDTSNDDYLSKISVLFSEWENNNSFEPSIKSDN